MRVLIVDDNAFILKIQTALVKKLTSNVFAVESGAKAISFLQHEQVDIVLMDMQMPEMDGVETTKRIRQFNSQIPIIAVTGNDSQPDRQKCLNAGMSGCLAKPLDINKLKAWFDDL